MKLIPSLLLLGAVGFTPLAAAEAHLDSVVLSDGSRLMGLVVEDADDHVTLRDNGSDRRLSRSRVLKIEYNDPDAPLYGSPADAVQLPATGTALQPTDDPALTDYCNGIAENYHVPVYQVVSVQQQLPADEVPVVFELALRSHRAPSMVLGLRLGGLSWGQVSLHLGLGNDAFYVDGGSVLIGSPYEHLYRGFWGLPRARWASLRLSDADIIDCVNFRFVSGYYHRPLIEVARVRQSQPVYRHAWRPVQVRRTVVVKEPLRRSVVVRQPERRTVVVRRPEQHRAVVTRPARRTVVEKERHTVLVKPPRPQQHARSREQGQGSREVAQGHGRGRSERHVD